MIGELKYTTFKTAMGWMGVMASSKGLLTATLPQRSAGEAYILLGDNRNKAISSPGLFEGLMKRLRFYFGGGKIDFPDELDLSAVTPFQRQVWEITRLIPYGETRSYSWVAKEMKRPETVRAVGQALSRNPLPVIIPCHRVVASNGQLGGFSGGMEMKQRLLNLEASVSTG